MLKFLYVPLCVCVCVCVCVCWTGPGTEVRPMHAPDPTLPPSYIVRVPFPPPVEEVPDHLLPGPLEWPPSRAGVSLCVCIIRGVISA